MIKNYFIILLVVLLCFSCASKKIKDITYLEKKFDESTLELNVFQLRNSDQEKSPVVIFIHGGYWSEGNKDIYGFLGRNFAKESVVTVIPNYTLSPNGNYDKMANDVVKAIQWTEDHIVDYGGDPNQIFLMGHSAGGHLIALVTTNPKYAKYTASIKGVILNDAAGLDMYSYLQEHPPTSEYYYKTTWTEDPKLWKDASPLYFLSEKSPPFFIYVGKKTYPSIINSNNVFVEELSQFQPTVVPIFLNKKHVPMMSQFFWPWNKRYDEIVDFIRKN